MNLIKLKAQNKLSIVKLGRLIDFGGVESASNLMIEPRQHSKSGKIKQATDRIKQHRDRRNQRETSARLVEHRSGACIAE